MANKRYTAEYVIEGNAADALREIQSAASGAESAIDKTGDSTKSTAIETTSFTDKVAKLKVAYELLAKQLIAATKEFAAQEAATGRLTRAFEQAGIESNKLAQATERMRLNRDKLGVSIQAQQDALRQLVEATGDAETAQSDLNLALDIASQENIRLEQATEALRKARNGEVEELKNLNGINKETASQLSKMEGDAERGAAAINMLRDSYAGAAEANAGTEERMAAFQEQLKEAQAALGQVVVAIADVIGALVGVIDILPGADLNMSNFADGLSNLADIITEVTDSIKMVTEEMTALEAIQMAIPIYQFEVFADVLDRAETNAANLKQRQLEINKLMGGTNLLGMAPGASERSTPAGAASVFGSVSQEEVDEWWEEQQDKKRKAQKKSNKATSKNKAALESAVDFAFGRASDAVESEREQEAAEEKEAALQREIELRNILAELRMDGFDLEARLIEIERSKMTEKEKELATQQAISAELAEQKRLAKAQADEAKKNQQQLASARMQAVSAYSSGTKELLSTFAEEEDAKRANALIDAAVYTYKAQAAFFDPSLGGPAGAFAFGSAAVGALAVAAGAGGGGGGAATKAGSSNGGGGTQSSQVNPEAAARRSARILAEELQRDFGPQGVTYNINYRSVAAPTEAEGRIIGEAIRKEQQTQVGGAGRTLMIGGG